MVSDLWTQIAEAAAFIRSKTEFQPEIGMILGTGLGDLGGRIEAECTIPYQDIPHFVESTATSHDGVLVCGKLGGRRVMATGILRRMSGSIPIWTDATRPAKRFCTPVTRWI